jgi:hypothetical protein
MDRRTPPGEGVHPGFLPPLHDLMTNSSKTYAEILIRRLMRIYKLDRETATALYLKQKQLPEAS